MGKRSMRVGVLAGLVVAATLALSPGVAGAAVSPTYAVSGAEYSATSTEGKFAGYALGSTGDTALWNADVEHQALSAGCYSGPPGCAIVPGGSITLATSHGDDVAGSFTGGSITLVRQASGCGKQVFHIVGALATNVGAATFDVALTHYRTSVFGLCVTYGATVGPDAADGIPGTLSF
jgi:hypothetical protein